MKFDKDGSESNFSDTDEGMSFLLSDDNDLIHKNIPIASSVKNFDKKL